MKKEVIFITVFLFFKLSLSYSSEDDYSVLFISSYSPTFPTFFEQTDGLRSVFDSNDISLNIEYMDSKQFPEVAASDAYFVLLSNKNNFISSYDLVITADDNALNFVITNYSSLFGGLPVVFFGVNDIETAIAQNNNPNITGVIEAVSMSDTLRLMAELNPGITEIFAIVDKTVSGQGDLVTFYSFSNEISPIVLDEFSLTNMTFTELSEEISQLQPETGVLLLSAYHDREGLTLDFDESLEVILSNAAVPVYHLWYHGIGDGLIGGKVISHYEQARTAADIAVKILNGTEIENINVITESPNRYILDDNELRKYDMNIKNLPYDINILNEKNIYKEYKKYFYISFIFAFVLVVFLSFMITVYIRLKKLKNELGVNEEKYRAYINNAPFCVYLINKEGTIIEANENALKNAHMKLNEMVNKNFIDFVITDQKEDVKDYFNQIITRGKGKTRFLVKMGDDGIRHKNANSSLLKNDNILMFINDITEQYKLEQSRKILEEQLRHSQKLESIGQLAGGVAHDLNNLLTPILGYSEILMYSEEDESSDNYEYFKTIHDVGLKAKNMTQQLLAFGRKQTLQMSVININKVINNFKSFISDTIREDIKVDYFLQSDIDLINADESQIEQIILNLVTNSQSAMPAGGKIIIETKNIELDESYVLSHEEVIPGKYVLTSVSDDGIGMKNEVSERIFEPFFTTKVNGLGTGLGLSTVYGIVKQHKGHVWVYSEPNKGTLFKIYIPAVKPSDKQSAPCNKEKHKSVYQPKDLLILLVEDNEDVRKMTANILKRLDFRVVTASDGINALELINNNIKPDLLLTDVIMPDLNGADLYRRIIKYLPEIKVLFMSGYTDNVIAHHGVLDDNVNFISKPFSIKTLKTKIDEIFCEI